MCMISRPGCLFLLLTLLLAFRYGSLCFVVGLVCCFCFAGLVSCLLLLLLLFCFCNVVSVGGVVGVVVCLWCRFVGRVCCLLLLRAFCFAGLVCCLLLLLLLFFGNVGNVVGVGGVVVSVVVCLWCRTKIRIRTGLSGRLFFYSCVLDRLWSRVVDGGQS